METRNPTMELLKQVLDVSALRHRVISQNIANVNTPGYHRLDVTFEDDLAKALKGSDAPSQVKPHVVVADGPERADGNTVDIDTETGNLQKNALLYSAALQILTHRVASQRAAIAGR